MRFRDADGNEYPASEVIEQPEVQCIKTDYVYGFHVPCADITRVWRFKADGREVYPIRESKNGRKVE